MRQEHEKERRTAGSRLHQEIRGLVAGVVAADAAEAGHRDRALAWLDRTGDIFRVTQAAPDPHLVSYFLLTDLNRATFLLVDHRKAGLWLPAGGHVEAGEHPVATVRREVREELGIEAEFSPVTGERPFFVTMTETTGTVDVHTDVSLWFILARSMAEPLTPDPREFRAARWWTRQEYASADPAEFDPHLGQLLGKLDAAE